MDFNFNINDFIKTNIVKINNAIMPDTFNGDSRQTRVCQEIMSVILDEMGEASAKAQGLLKPITNTELLRNKDHIVYLLVEKEGNHGKGSVVGMLKMGRKSLYVFDECGDCHNVLCLCVLDFYVHESRQRMGYGKILFDYMLEEEHIKPIKLAIDRPSEKFISFLKKHYGLENIIRQTNNFVVFRGFFNNLKNNTTENSPRRSYGSPYRATLDDKVTYNGRFTAHKRESTIGKCLNWSGHDESWLAQVAPNQLYTMPHALASVPPASSSVKLF
ncbi:unnamed protein product [Nezara viridula]|uniref:Alpha-tubulin N-acetyltransferase n=1 Tax=Nezara viridula TaxID=85310 RepID=A0A9P0E8L5_NEZVI|nr:unnamed protein product [Nezara viridula]